jgi:hypothetical protein
MKLPLERIATASFGESEWFPDRSPEATMVTSIQTPEPNQEGVKP